LARRATKLEPANPIPYVNLAIWYSAIGELENAEIAASKALELNPDIYGAPGQLAIISLLRGEPEQALTRADAIKLEMLDSMARAIAHHELGNNDESNRILEAFIKQHEGRYAKFIAIVHAWQGDRDSAFRWLDRAIDEQQDLDGLKTDALFRNLRSDPRWEKALMRVGLADVQVSAIEF
jgi:tetratricopeptide (TPR) repeat protein